jgi:Lipid-droplet associated hydrolase
VKTEVKTILQWPSDTFSIDYGIESAQNHHRSPPPVHTILVFIPGNPGLIDWYVPFFTKILKRLVPGFACRGVALAGHSLDPKLVNVEQYIHDSTIINNSLRDTAIPWTVDGQVQHKCAYMDLLMEEFGKVHCAETKHYNDSENNKDYNHHNNNSDSLCKKPRFIFVSHSIGAHFTQRLCILRPDILQRTRLLIHLIPFIRMDAPIHMQSWLNTCARASETAITIVKALSKLLPRPMRDKLLSVAMNDKEGRDIAVRLLQIPTFVRNIGILGLEEVRDVPQDFDVSGVP